MTSLIVFDLDGPGSTSIDALPVIDKAHGIRKLRDGPARCAVIEALVACLKGDSK